MKNKILSTICLSSFIVLPSIAQEQNPFEITPLVGYRFGGDFEIKGEEYGRKIKTEEATSYGILFAFPYDNKRQSELLFTHYSTELSATRGILPDPINNDVDAGLSISYLHFGGNVPVSDGNAPVKVSGGLGLTHFSPSDSKLSDETQFSLNIGLNKQFPITDNLRFRLGSRIYGTFFDSNSKIFCGSKACGMYVSGSLWVQGEVNAGLTFAF